MLAPPALAAAGVRVCRGDRLQARRDRRRASARRETPPAAARPRTRATRAGRRPPAGCRGWPAPRARPRAPASTRRAGPRRLPPLSRSRTRSMIVWSSDNAHRLARVRERLAHRGRVVRQPALGRVAEQRDGRHPRRSPRSRRASRPARGRSDRGRLSAPSTAARASSASSVPSACTAGGADASGTRRVERHRRQPIDRERAAASAEERTHGGRRRRRHALVGIVERVERGVERARVADGLERAQRRRTRGGGRGRRAGRDERDQPLDGARADDRQARHCGFALDVGPREIGRSAPGFECGRKGGRSQ